MFKSTPGVWFIEKGTSVLVWTKEARTWDRYTTEERMAFPIGEVGKTTVTFRLPCGSLLQIPLPPEEKKPRPRRYEDIPTSLEDALPWRQ